MDNFFCSQLNDAVGELDIAGTFGDANQNAAGGFNVVGGRQGWDVTSIEVSSAAGHFNNGQTEAVLRAVTTGDSFVPTATAFAIEVNAPDFSSRGNGASGSPLLIGIDQSSTITVDMRNDGLVDATGLIFRAPVPEGLDLVSFTLDGSAGDIDGAAVDVAGLQAGVAVGDVEVGVARQIIFDVVAVGTPADGQSYVIEPQWDYGYVSGVGEPPLTEPHSTELVVIDFEPSAATTGGLDDTAGEGGSAGDEAEGSATGVDTVGGEGDSGSTSGFVSGSGTAGTTTEEDGCGCRSQRSTPGWTWTFLLPVLVRRRATSPKDM